MRGKDILGFLNILIVLGILGGISYLALVLQPEEYDPDTLCLAGDVPPHVGVVIDKTDLYSPEQAARIEALVLENRDRLQISERMTLFELDARGELVNTNDFSLCNPGRGDQINPLYRNPQRVEARYQALFEGPLQAALSDLVEPKESPSSPIIESLARLAVTENFGPETPGRRIVLVSDMLQNSQLFTVYGRNRGALESRLPDPRDVAAAIEDEVGDALAGVTIEVYLIPRRTWERDQETVIRAYWSEVFRQLGVRDRWSAL
ncbi:MAG: hypothetical protein NXI12_08975 [Alphaproteobacteria bacterium]|nr:hypothetical protein [Alphaproteobacteria bacterium]